MSININARTISGVTYNMTINENATISQVKQILIDKHINKPSIITSVYMGRVLNDDTTLKDNGFTDGSTMILVIKDKSPTNTGKDQEPQERPLPLNIIDTTPDHENVYQQPTEPWNVQLDDQILSDFDQDDVENIEQLVTMGFDRTFSTQVYIACEKDMTDAINLLLDG